LTLGIVRQQAAPSKFAARVPTRPWQHRAADCLPQLDSRFNLSDAVDASMQVILVVDAPWCASRWSSSAR
jgi:hypothetical protein